MINKEGEVQKLETFLRELKDYRHYRLLKDNRCYSLRNKLLEDSGRLRTLATELTGKEKVIITWKSGQESSYDIWFKALQLQFSEDASFALNCGIDLITVAIGKLKADIEMGTRDEQGNVIQKLSTTSSEPPKAFIAHEGETRALSMVNELLESLEIKYFIAEVKASSGRSIERQVDWTQSKADFAICLATKGKAINKKTGKHYMAPNVADELGRARQFFGNKVILLLQKGVEPHTNVREIVYEHFTTTNMEKAFIKIIKELKNWGFITTGKIKE
jgi:predicted nucleotide-binding protein